MCNCHLFFRIEGYPIIPDKTENAGKIITLASEVPYPSSDVKVNMTSPDWNKNRFLKNKNQRKP